MKPENYYRCLEVPKGPVDVVLDTDAYNEIDDQFAIAYLLRSEEKLRVKGLCAAPFYNDNSTSPADGMEKSYHEIHKVLSLAGREDLIPHTYRGAETYLPDEKTPVVTEAATFMAELSRSYTEENPLYIIAIGAITNVASAFLLRPEMKDCTVVVWLGGHAHHMPQTDEFNMRQDIAAARVIFGCGVPLVQLPCAGVVDHFHTSLPELERWFKGKNPLTEYLADNTFKAAGPYGANRPWSRVIWDVTAVGWLVGGDRFMLSRLVPAPMPEYDFRYGMAPDNHLMRYVYYLNRDALFADLVNRLTKE